MGWLHKLSLHELVYPKCTQNTPESIAFMVNQLQQCDDTLDLILLPECCNAPSGCGDSGLLRRLVAENTQMLLDAAKETAKRCRATVGINLYVHGEGYETTVRNATLLFDSQGQLAAQYDKQYLPVSEYTNDFIDHSYLCSNPNPFCAEHYYIASEDASVLRTAAEVMPDTERCLICPEADTSLAQTLGCHRIQLGAGTQVSKAKEAGLRCNLVLTEDPSQANALLEKGVDCIVTSQYLAVRNCVENR